MTISFRHGLQSPRIPGYVPPIYRSDLDMKKFLILLLCAAAFAPSVRAESSLGVGLRYFQMTDSLPKPFKDRGGGGFINWRTYFTDWFGAMAEVDVYVDGFAGTRNEVLSPQAFLVLGRPVYAAVGGGYLFCDGDLSDDPFLALRLGAQGPLTTWFMYDISVSYEFAEWSGVNDVDDRFESDTVVIGAGLRVLF